jgi:outer membrane protein assembly factor BamB/tetratricopeptide (TPR) repeat protein
MRLDVIGGDARRLKMTLRQSHFWLALASVVIASTIAIKPLLAAPPAAPNLANLGPDELIQRLGDRSFAAREAAAARLTKLGLKCREQLADGLKAADPEIRRRCRLILSDVLDAQLAANIERFKADKDGKQQYDIPGWTRFQETIGSDPAARRLFTRMLQQEPALLEAADRDNKTLAVVLRTRIRQLYRGLTARIPTQRVKVSAGSVATVLFATSQLGDQLPKDRTTSNLLSTLSQQTAFTTELREGDIKQPARKLFGRWLQMPAGNLNDQQKVRLAVTYELKDAGLHLSVRLLNAKPPQARTQAACIEALARLGGQECSGLLTPLLDDKGVCTTRTVNGNRSEIQVRDVALAWLIYLAKQDHNKFNFGTAKKWFDYFKKTKMPPLNYAQFIFNTPEDRDRALAKWHEWVKKNPIGPVPAKLVDLSKQAANEKPNIAAGNGKPATPADDDPDAWLGWRLADRIVVSKLDSARILIERQDYAQAIGLLGAILAADEDFIFRGTGNDANVYRALKSAAEKLMNEIPVAELTNYELRYGIKARRELKQSLDSGDPNAVAAVADAYFFTKAGAEAQFLLGCMYLDQGAFLHAAFQFKRMWNRPQVAESFEPALSLKLATCWHQAALPQKAVDVLTQLKAKHPGPTVAIGGSQIELFTSDSDALTWLEQHVIAATQPGQIPESPAGEDAAPSRLIPFLSGEPLGHVATDYVLKEVLGKIRSEEKALRIAAVPSLRPLIVGDTIVFRTLQGLRAVSLDGSLLWQAPLLGAIEHFIRQTSADKQAQQSEFLISGLRTRLRDNNAFGSLSTNGRHIYLIENLGFEFGGNHQAHGIQADGRRALLNDTENSPQILSAWDVETGKLIWETSDIVSKSPSALANVSFLGAPLPFGNRLCAVAEVGPQICLLMLDASTGELQWQCTLAVNENSTSPAALLGRSWLPGLIRPLRRFGSQPVLADEMLVCYAGENRYAAIDLIKRRVAWVYEEQQGSPLGAPPGRNVWQWQQRFAKRLRQRDRWIDPTPTAIKDGVLLTLPATDSLVCLNLADGSVRWQAPRDDGLYVTAIDHNTSLVVGRSGLRALALDSGEPIWSPGTSAILNGGTPSGRGYQYEGDYYLPLSSAEVAAIDVRTGKWEFVSRSLAGIVPGNLSIEGDTVVSQDRSFIYQFEGLAKRADALAEKLRANPNDAQVLMQLAETYLYDGQLQQALDHVAKAIETAPDEKGKSLLSRTLVAGLRSDDAKFVGEATRFEASLDGSPLGEMLFELGQRYQRSDQPLAAFQAYIRFIESRPDLAKLNQRTSAWKVRNDRWLIGRLAEIHTAADQPLRHEIDRLVVGQQKKLPHAQFITIFGFHPAAVQTRLQLAEELASKKQLLSAERILRQAIESGEDAHRAAALAQLATILSQQGKSSAAANCYQQLASRHAEQICRGNQTGKQLFDALPTESPIRNWFQPRSLWPQGAISAKHLRRDRKKLVQIQPTYPITVVRQTIELDAPLTVGMDFMGNGKLIARDSLGREIVKIDLPKGNPSLNTVRYGRGRAAAQGHLVICWLGDRLCAVDTAHTRGKLLWTTPVYLPNPSNFPGVQLRMNFRMPLQATALRDSVALPFKSTHNYVCFQVGQALRAVDPLSGKLLWERDDVPAECDIFGDDEIILVTGRSAEHADVFSAIDGQRLGQRPVPQQASRVAAIGRRVLTWKVENGSSKISLIDPWEQQTVWETQFDENAKPWLIDDSQVAVLAPDGRFVAIRTADGTLAIEAKLDPIDQLESIYVRRWADRYILMTNRRQTKPVRHRMPQHFVPTNGAVYALDAKNGALHWQAPVEGQYTLQSSPANLPALIFYSRHQQAKQLANGGISYGTPNTRIVCVNLRNGKRVHESETKGGYDYYYELKTDPTKGTIELRTRLETLTLTCAKK